MITVKNIPITFIENYSREQTIKIIQSHKLLNYIEKNITNKNVKIKSIRIDKVNFFGNEIGFIYLESEIFVNGNQVPGIAFLRGDSVAVMLVLNTINNQKDNEQYTILVEQYRPNIGKFSKGIPAGMIDNEGEITSTAITEIEEEVGKLGITKDNLKFLTEYHPSNGGCDEKITIFSAEVFVNYEKLMGFQDKITGSASEKEIIKLDVIKLKNIVNYGMKANLAFNEFNKKNNCRYTQS